MNPPSLTTTSPINFQNYILDKTICFLYPNTPLTRVAFRFPQNQKHQPTRVPIPKVKEHPSMSSTQELSSETFKALEKLREGTPLIEDNPDKIYSNAPPPLLTLKTDANLLRSNKAEFFFGSDPSKSDFLLDDKKTHGVSGRHIRISILYEHDKIVLGIQNLSRNTIDVISVEKKLDATLGYQNFQNFPCDGGPWTIKLTSLEEISFTLLFPTRDQVEETRIFQNDLIKFIHRTDIKNPQPASGMAIKEEETPRIPPRAFDWEAKVRLGKGGQGSVYKVKDQKTGEYFAAKIFGKHEHFKKELGFLRVLNHRHIVKFVDVTENGGDQQNPNTIIMEYLPNGTLHSKLRTGLDLTLAKVYWFQLCTALEYLHSQNILHRDIKPTNILFSSSNTIKLCDFGMSKTLVDKDSTNTQLGTPCYMGPERIMGKDYGQKDDVWALGIVVLDMHYLLPRDKPQWTIAKGKEEVQEKVWGEWMDNVRTVVEGLEGDEEKVSKGFNVLRGMLMGQKEERLSAREVINLLSKSGEGRGSIVNDKRKGIGNEALNLDIKRLRGGKS